MMRILLQNVVGIPVGLLGLLLLSPLWIPALALTLFGRLLRFVARWIEPRYLEWNALICYDEKLGWRPSPSLRTHHLVDDVYSLTTDSEGWRSETRLENSQILALGDSFAWGFGIDDEDFFANRFSSPRVKAVGAVGYNMVQELMCLETLGPRLRGKLVVWMIFYGNDLWENLTPNTLGYRMPFARKSSTNGHWVIEDTHISDKKWFCNSTRVQGNTYYEMLAELCAPTQLSSRAFSACRYLIERGKKFCERQGARLAVMGIPERVQYDREKLRSYLRLQIEPELVQPDYPDKKLRQICLDLEIPFVALRDYLDPTSYKESDCHWNRRGHEQVAEILNELYYRLKPKSGEASKVLEEAI